MSAWSSWRGWCTLRDSFVMNAHCTNWECIARSSNQEKFCPSVSVQEKDSSWNLKMRSYVCMQVTSCFEFCSRILQESNIYRMLFRVKSHEQQTQANISEIRLQLVWTTHINARALKQLFEKKLVSGASLNNKAFLFYESCQIKKVHKLLFNK